MIYLYSGTPGSGKSLDTARVLYYQIKYGKPSICNFEINVNKIKSSHKGDFVYLDNSEMTPEFLIKYSKEYFKTRKFKEGVILLVLDECQLIFNARDWQMTGRKEWLSFFTQHRKYGYDIILVAQFDRMIDRQIRSLIEYEVVHRKVSNFGIQGKIISMFSMGKLFVAVKVWYPLKEKTGSTFFKANKRFYSIYDSYKHFDDETEIKEKENQEKQAVEVKEQENAPEDAPVINEESTNLSDNIA